MSPIANSTQISNRLFRNQRYMNLIILSVFLTILIITSISAHKHMKNGEYYDKASEKINSYLDSAKKFSGKEKDE
ncbi:unnamed protein product [Debaryomyces fabryi]|nr:unnamed protein product [Debaryomyces fabryi]